MTPSRRRISWAAAGAALAVVAAGCAKFFSYPKVDTENTMSKCSDGVDNDLDGKTDCADPSCDGFCPEASAAACNDGRDNDGDGLTDSADPSCWPVAPPQVQRCAEAKGVDIVENFDVGPQWGFPGSPWHRSGALSGLYEVLFARHGDYSHRQDAAVSFQFNTNASATGLDTASMGALVRQWAFSGNWQNFALSFSAFVPIHSAMVAALVPVDFAPPLDRPIPGSERALFAVSIDQANPVPTMSIDVGGLQFSAPLPLVPLNREFFNVRVSLGPDGFDAVATYLDSTPNVEVRAPPPTSLELPPARLVFWGGSTTSAASVLDDVHLHVAADRPCTFGVPQIPGPACSFTDRLHAFGHIVSLTRGDQGEYCALVTASHDPFEHSSVTPSGLGAVAVGLLPETLTAWRSVDGAAWTPAPDAPPVELVPGTPLVGASIAHDTAGWHLAVAYRATNEVRLGFASSPTCGAWGQLRPGPILFTDAEAPSFVIAAGRQHVYFTRPPTALSHRSLWIAPGDDPESIGLALVRLADLPLDVGAPVSVQRIGSRDLALVYPTAAPTGLTGAGVGLLVGDPDGRSWNVVGSSPILQFLQRAKGVETGEGWLAFDSLGVTSAALSWDQRGGFLLYGGYSAFGWSGSNFIDRALAAGTARLAPAGGTFAQGAATSGAGCGDGTCDASETCASCAADCPCAGPVLLTDVFGGQRTWSIVSGDPTPTAVHRLDTVNSALNWAGSTAVDGAGQPSLRPPPTWSVLALPRAIAGDFELSFDLVVSWIDPNGRADWCSTYIGLGTVADPAAHTDGGATGDPDGVFARIAYSGQCGGRYMATPFVQSRGTSFGVSEAIQDALGDAGPPVCQPDVSDRYVPVEIRRRVVLRRQGDLVKVDVARGDGCGVLEQQIRYASALPELPNLLVGFGSGDGTREPGAGFAACLALAGAGSISNLELRLLDDPDHCPPAKALCGTGSQQPTCVDTSATLEHCGACNSACGVNEICKGGICSPR